MRREPGARAAGNRSSKRGAPEPHRIIRLHVHRPTRTRLSQPLCADRPRLGAGALVGPGTGCGRSGPRTVPGPSWCPRSEPGTLFSSTPASCRVRRPDPDRETAHRKPPPAERSSSAPRRSPRSFRRPVRIRPQRPESGNPGRPRGKRRTRIAHTTRTRTGQGHDVRRNRRSGDRERRGCF